MNLRHKVTILQHRLLHYRVGLFEKLHAECARRGIELHLVHGQPSPKEALKKDTGSIAWSTPVRNRWLSAFGRDLLWQPLPANRRDADLLIVMQENRILSNYPIILGRLLGGTTRIAYWGHGKNFQSDRPDGLLEGWKRFWLTKVDWWFGYTGLTTSILTSKGFPRERITCLNNAIDNERFLSDLSQVSDDTLDRLRGQLALAPGAPLGLYCGSLYPDKRLDLMVASAERIRMAIPDFQLVVIGDGPSRPELDRLLSGKPWARCIGARKGMEKAEYFRLADVVLSPGAVGLHVLDAFCAGLPMFTTRNARHGPEIEYLEHGRNGFVLEDDPSAFGDAVVALLQDRTRYENTCRAAEEAGRRYTLDNMVANFVDGLEACLNDQPLARTA